MLSKAYKKGGRHYDDKPSNEAGPSKMDQYSSDEDEEPPNRKGLPHQSSKMSKQGGNMSKKSPGITKQSGGHGHHNKPAELFRKDLISAMKLADTEILYDDEYYTILDPWRQEWEKGVQVPVNEEEIPPIKIVDVKNREKDKDFKMHPRKYLHDKNDETYQAVQHELTGMQDLSEQIVRYDLDDMDVTWLELVNADREEMGLQVINEWNLERMIEELENQCYAKTNSVKKTEEGLGIEYDEDIACDVCRQLESEDTNEMVFCDGCDICVHQACYGIQTIPEGSWLCRICALGIKPMCLLCPKRGGAMKSTKSGTKWTHVSCALWIPEVSIGCPEKMEPVTKISNIPASRWALVCCLCKERVGACIQCTVKQCKTAFHVTCGFAHNLDMKTILDDTDELDGIHLRAYCPKHTKNRNASDSESPKKNEEGFEETEDNENEVSEAEMAKQRAEKLKQLEEEFYTLVDEQEISTKFFIPEEAVSVVTEYWKMKRKVNFNKPLITPKVEEENQMQKQQKDSLSARMKMFVHLRQDLERARNLCYMIGKREKTKKQLFKLQESVFRVQVDVLTDPNLELTSREAEKIRQLIHFDSIYSSFFHQSSASKLPRKNLFDIKHLKTPKDLMEEKNSKFEEVIKKKLSKKMKHSKHSKHSKQSMKIEVKEEPMTSDAGNVDLEDSVKEEILGVDKVSKFLSDTTGDSSDNEMTTYDGPKTDSTQMSHLGKVKGGEEIIEEPEQEMQDVMEDVQEVETSGSGNKRTAGSDLKMKLTSILQSKSLKQKQNKLSQSEHINSILFIDVENSDNDVFSSESNTDFASPVQQSRNLFDKFKMKEPWSSSDHASPDIPQKDRQADSGRHKKAKRKYKESFKKYKQSKLALSRSSAQKVETKEKDTSDSDSRNIIDTGKETDDNTSLISPNNDSSDGESLHRNKVKDGSSSRLSLLKKKSSRDWSISSPRDENPSFPKKHKKMSPSPRVDPENVYATIDGDIYVPSGKIQVTERTIVLESPKETKTKLSNKLRLKKQANSPIKGVVSYEVVNSDCDECVDIFDSAKEKADDAVMSCLEEDTHRVSRKEESTRSDKKKVSEKKKTSKEDVASCDMKVSEKKNNESKYGKLLSDSDGNISVDLRDAVEEMAVKKDLFGITESQSVNKKDEERTLKQSLRSKERNSELDSSSDENFIPSNKTTKLYTANKPHRPQRECRSNSNSKPVIKVQPFPNRPEINALVDPSKLIVKEPLKRRIGDKLSQIVKGRTRWGNRLNSREKDQRTLDSFVKKADRVFSPGNEDISSLVRPGLKSTNISKNLENGFLSKKIISNGDVLQRTPSKNSLSNHGLSVLSEDYTGIDKHSLSYHSNNLLVDVNHSDRLKDDDVMSEGSVASRLSNDDLCDRADTPRRSTRNRSGPDDSQSPQTPSRLRSREGLIKPPPFKAS